MRYNYKYAMPVDPRVLQDDFESSKGVDTIPELVATLKKVRTTKQYMAVDDVVRKQIKRLWFEINYNRGINLRDREKLLPVFQQLARIFKKTEHLGGGVYRGVTLPSIYKTLISETFPDAYEGEDLDIHSHPEIVQKIENLAYGLRSWSKDPDYAEQWADDRESYAYKHSKQDHDSVVFFAGSYYAVLDCDAYFEVMGEIIEGKGMPFDHNEVICHLDGHKVERITKVRDKSDSSALWFVEIN